MRRLLVAALPLVAGLLPFSALALGLGEINLRSALNQPFLAEIPVSADSPEELNRLQVELAPRETFQRFGLDRPAFLGNFSFTVEPTGSQSGIIRISSTRPVSEPFVTLLIEARWERGRLLREYTVLLDPPAFVPEAPAAAPALPAATPQPAAPAAAPARPAPATAAPSPAPAAAPGGSYQVERNDTLWQVANQLRPEDVTVNQMMLALFRANPEAFAGNINRLRAGAILRVPDGDGIRSLGQAQATAEVRQQNAAWQGDQGARLELLPPAEAPAPRPAAAAQGEAPAALQSRVGQLESELEEARRLLAVRDDELRALQAQLAAEVEPPVAATPAPLAEDPFVAEPAPAGTGPDAEAAVEAEAAPAALPPAETVVRTTPAASSPTLLDTIIGLLTSVWLWVAAAIVVLISLFVIRRRRESGFEAYEEPTGRWDMESGKAPVVAAAGADDSFIVEEQQAARGSPPAFTADEADDLEDSSEQTQATEILPGPPAARDTTLERTISPDGAMDLDATDVVAEADFHMAYGLYDQAAELLNGALLAEPARRDLRMKLLEVLFVWENKGAFLNAARALREQVQDENDGDWAKARIMGQQLCPGDALFAGSQAPAVAGDLDLPLTEEQDSGTVDFGLDGPDDEPGGSRAGQDDGLDFDLGDAEPAAGGGTTSVETVVTGAETMETPTIEARFGGDSPTMENPALHDSAGDSPTMETPTIETRASWDSGAEAPDQTEEIDLDELGLDLSELDEAVDGLGTGEMEAPDLALGDQLAEEAGDEDLEFDLTEAMLTPDADEEFADSTSPASAEDDLQIEPTAEIPAFKMDEDTGLVTDLDRDAAGAVIGGETAAHYRAEETAEQPALDEQVDFDPGEDLGEDFEPTATVHAGGAMGVDGPTMTEVGTKLDLARAYVDMGDPEGARSILNEVLEEGDSTQRQQARQLLSDLDDPI